MNLPLDLENLVMEFLTVPTKHVKLIAQLRYQTCFAKTYFGQMDPSDFKKLELAPNLLEVVVKSYMCHQVPNWDCHNPQTLLLWQFGNPHGALWTEKD